MTAQPTPEQRLTIIKHLAGGKSPEVVAAIVGLTRNHIVDIASHHGYPHPEKLTKAADLLAARLDKERADAIPTGTVRHEPVARPRVAAVQTAKVPLLGDQPAPAPAPDEIKALLNTAKGHPSKRIQRAADKVLDDLGRLRQLLKDDEEKNSEKRRLEKERAAAKAEVERLEQQLREAKAKLRKSPHQQPGGRAAVASGQIERARTLGQAALLSNTDLEPHGLTSKDLRAWASKNDIDCPTAGRVPRRVFDIWLARHTESEKSA